MNLDDEEKAIALLCMMPNSWDHLIKSMSFSNPKYFDYETVVGALLLQEK